MQPPPVAVMGPVQQVLLPRPVEQHPSFAQLYLQFGKLPQPFRQVSEHSFTTAVPAEADRQAGSHHDGDDDEYDDDEHGHEASAGQVAERVRRASHLTRRDAARAAIPVPDWLRTQRGYCAPDFQRLSMSPGCARRGNESSST